MGNLSASSHWMMPGSWLGLDNHLIYAVLFPADDISC